MDQYTKWGMTLARYRKLMEDEDEDLTKKELRLGWYFSTEYDGLLVNSNWKGHEA